MVFSEDMLVMQMRQVGEEFPDKLMIGFVVRVVSVDG
jgi:hypothetical protein